VEKALVRGEGGGGRTKLNRLVSIGKECPGVRNKTGRERKKTHGGPSSKPGNGFILQSWGHETRVLGKKVGLR